MTALLLCGSQERAIVGGLERQAASAAEITITAGGLMDGVAGWRGPIRLTVRNGRVAAVDTASRAAPAGAGRHLDLGDFTLLPGGIGLYGASREPEGTEGFTPELRLSENLDLADPAIVDGTRLGAISILLQGPPASIVAGISSVVRPLDVWSGRRTIAERIGLVLHPHARTVAPKRHVMEATWEIRRRFLEARDRGSVPGETGQNNAFAAVLDGSLLAQFPAGTLAEFVRAVRIGQEFDVPLLLTGVQEVPHTPLRGVRLRVLMGPARADSFRELWDGYVRLRNAGIPAGILTGELPLVTALALSRPHARRLGLTDVDIVHAFTAAPAGILETPSIGTLEYGRSADFLAVSGTPFEPDARIERVFIEGREIYDRSRDR